MFWPHCSTSTRRCSHAALVVHAGVVGLSRRVAAEASLTQVRERRDKLLKSLTQVRKRLVDAVIARAVSQSGPDRKGRKAKWLAFVRVAFSCRSLLLGCSLTRIARVVSVSQFRTFSFDIEAPESNLRRFSRLCDNWDTPSPRAKRSAELRLCSREGLSVVLRECWGVIGMQRMVWQYYGELFMQSFMRVVYLLAWCAHFTHAKGEAVCACHV